MQLNKILEKIGVTVVRVEKPSSGDSLRLFLRVGRDPRQFSQWKGVVEEFILAGEENVAKKPDVGWACDISQAYYPTKEQTVRYLWRVIITGNRRVGAESFGQAVLRVVSQSAEVTEMPLVGRKEYAFDPANGKMKGAHNSKSAAALISVGMSGGKIQ